MSVNNHKISVGADPELFVLRDKKFFSAHNLIPGTKEEPFPVEGGAVQVDGMALEFNINPATSPDEFERNISTVMGQLKSMVPDYDFLDSPSVHFKKEDVSGLPFRALRLGCEPDFDAYTLEANCKPDVKVMMRTAGGHVHAGGEGLSSSNPFGPEHLQKCAELSKIMDEELGIYSLLWDEDDQRRSMYGKAGAFRPKMYGFEYRSLSNKWIWSKKTINFVYDATERAVKRLFDGRLSVNNDARDCINNSVRDHPLLCTDRALEVRELLV